MAEAIKKPEELKKDEDLKKDEETAAQDAQKLSDDALDQVSGGAGLRRTVFRSGDAMPQMQSTVFHSNGTELQANQLVFGGEQRGQNALNSSKKSKTGTLPPPESDGPVWV